MPVIGDGYHALGPGKLGTLVTYLEMEAPATLPHPRAPEGYHLQRVERWTLDEFKRLYIEIGFEWMWSSRLLMSEAELEARLSRPGTEAFVPVRATKAMGVLEMDFAKPSDVEISFFGLVPSAVGKGTGRWLMEEAIRLAFLRPETRRLWLHTCHFDSPQALPFYQRMGFKPYARAIEVFDDVRLLGRLDPTAGPHVPLIRDARWPDGVEG